MTRAQFIEQLMRQIYGGQPSDDANITDNLINQWINQAIGIAAKKNYTDSIQLDGVAYVNNSFYCTFKGIAITASTIDNNVWQFTLPHVPVGIGRNEGISSLQFKDSTNNTSYPAIPLSVNEQGIRKGLRTMPNKIWYWYEGNIGYCETPFPLYTCTATVQMISGGDSTDLTSVFRIPDDYIPLITDYVTKQLSLQRAQPQDAANDGTDKP